MQPAAQVHGDDAEDTAQQEGHPPAPLAHFGRGQALVDRGGDQGAKQDAGRQSRRERAAGDPDPTGRDVLGDERPGARHFTADGGALQDTQSQQGDGGADAEHRIGGQQTDQQGRQRHHEDAEGEHPLAADEITEVSHDDAAERAGQITGGEDAEGLELAQPLGNIGREEQLADDDGEEDEDDEVVKLQRTAEGSQTQGLVILSIEGAGVIVLLCGCGHIRMFPIGFFSYSRPGKGGICR